MLKMQRSQHNNINMQHVIFLDPLYLGTYIIKSVTHSKKRKKEDMIYVMSKHHDYEITAVLISTIGHAGSHGCTCKIFQVHPRVPGKYFKIEF